MIDFQEPMVSFVFLHWPVPFLTVFLRGPFLLSFISRLGVLFTFWPALSSVYRFFFEAGSQAWALDRNLTFLLLLIIKDPIEQEIIENLMIKWNFLKFLALHQLIIRAHFKPMISTRRHLIVSIARFFFILTSLCPDWSRRIWITLICLGFYSVCHPHHQWITSSQVKNVLQQIHPFIFCTSDCRECWPPNSLNSSCFNPKWVRGKKELGEKIQAEGKRQKIIKDQMNHFSDCWLPLETGKPQNIFSISNLRIKNDQQKEHKAVLNLDFWRIIRRKEWEKQVSNSL